MSNKEAILDQLLVYLNAGATLSKLEGVEVIVNASGHLSNLVITGARFHGNPKLGNVTVKDEKDV